ncbi:MAG: hypothetical protein J6U53_02745 [Tidjanibacter sp.]|nr:hypothetical protein [Tidjanibacter sp.]
MKTYTTDQKLGRLTAYLVAVMKPFAFDGNEVEFTATENFMQRMVEEDPALAKVDFKTR